MIHISVECCAKMCIAFFHITFLFLPIVNYESRKHHELQIFVGLGFLFFRHDPKNYVVEQ